MILLPDESFGKQGTSVESGLLVFDRAAGGDRRPSIAVTATLAQAREAVLAIPARFVDRASAHFPLHGP